MSRTQRAPNRCPTCGAVCNVFMCAKCAGELRALLIGSRQRLMVGEVFAADHHGIIWCVDKLREQAWRQSKLTVMVSRGSGDGYGLIVDEHAATLLAQISASLANWEAIVLALRGPQGDATGEYGSSVHRGSLQSPESARARYLASKVELIRNYCPDAHRLHTDMLIYGRDAIKAINRKVDHFCGPCPTTLDNAERCDTPLYVEEDAAKVQCPNPSCRSVHDVEKLRTAMRVKLRDMLFTGPQLRRIMENRLADRLPEATFRKMVRDGRLLSSGRNSDGEDMYTYNDVCDARAKPVPTKRKAVRL